MKYIPLLLLCIGCTGKVPIKADVDVQAGLSNRISKLEIKVGDVESQIGGLQAGRDITTTTEDSWQDVVVIFGVSGLALVALFFAWNRERARMHAEKGICRIAKNIETMRYRGSLEEQAAIGCLIRRIRGHKDVVESVINRNVKRATG